jgi:hypothetical protein
MSRKIEGMANVNQSAFGKKPDIAFPKGCCV